MSKSSPAFQFYPLVFIGDENVKVMSNQHVGCYIKLLCHNWIEGSIPADITMITKLVGEDHKDSSAMAELWAAIRPCFTEAHEKPGRLVNPKLEKVRQEQENYRAERAASGAKGAKTRWDKRSGDSGANGTVNGAAYGSAMQHPIANDSSLSLPVSIDKDIDHNKEKDATPESNEPSPLGEIEQYLQGRTQSALLSGFDMTAVLDWVKRTDGNVQIVKDGIDAGLKIFQRDNPGQVPRSAKFYSGYVEKAWSRHKAGGAGDGRTTRPRDADPQATGPGVGQGGAPAAGTPNPLAGPSSQTGAGKPEGPSGAGRQPSFNSLSQ